MYMYIYIYIHIYNIYMRTETLIKYVRGLVAAPATTLPETNSQFAPENGWLEYYNPEV